MSELIKADNEYKEWIAGISTDFRKSQIRASMKINDEMLRFYWKLGKGISSMSEQFGYGTGFYKTVSDDLKSILPDVKSFSPTNLKYMRYFYEMYPDAVICPQVEDELITDANRPQVGDDLQIIFRIPWGHNKIILDKCKENSAKARDDEQSGDSNSIINQKKMLEKYATEQGFTNQLYYFVF